MKTRALVGAVLALAVVTAWACGQATPVRPSTGTPGSGGASGAAPQVIRVLGGGGSDAFSPDALTAQAGSSVVWTNSDDQAHHIVAADGSFDTGVLEPDQESAPISVPASGASYSCTIHPGETGSIKPAS